MDKYVLISLKGDLISSKYTIDKDVDECPICHNKVTPKGLFIYMPLGTENKNRVSVAYSCPNDACNEIFLAFYERDPNAGTNSTFYFNKCAPFNYNDRIFDQIITNVSSEFVEIYNQSRKAEINGLYQICGMGYRKALEFLIKSYLINQLPAEKDNIEKSMLGNCIKNYMAPGNLKDCAERATWLGNDETHYIRKWADKDIADLKALIDLTVHWIIQEELTKQYIQSMPKQGAN